MTSTLTNVASVIQEDMILGGTVSAMRGQYGIMAQVCLTDVPVK
jgi:hypothetical protein